MKISNIISNAIKQSGHKAEYIASLSGITESYISKIVNDKLKNPPADETLIKIASALNLNDSIKKELLELAALERTPDLVKKMIYSNMKYNEVTEYARQNRKLFIDFIKENEIALSYEEHTFESEYGYQFKEQDLEKNFKAFIESKLKYPYSDISAMDEFRCYIILTYNDICEGFLTTQEILTTSIPMKQIPIYGSVSAGNGCLAYGEVTGYSYTSSQDYIEGMFALKVVGDSMEQRIPEGALVEVVPMEQLGHELHNKDIGVFITNGDEGIVKQFFKEDEFYRLVSFNPAYRDIIIPFSRDDFRIVGKVKGMRIVF